MMIAPVAGAIACSKLGLAIGAEATGVVTLVTQIIVSPASLRFGLPIGDGTDVCCPGSVVISKAARTLGVDPLSFCLGNSFQTMIALTSNCVNNRSTLDELLPVPIAVGLTQQRPYGGAQHSSRCE
jgi:hypothetical protein